MNIGEAVKERIIELCRERDISVNKLCNMSGVTQSTVNNIVSGRNNSATISTIKSCAMAWVSRFRSFLRQIFLLIWNRRLNKTDGGCISVGSRRLTLFLLMFFFLGLILRNGFVKIIHL